MSFLQDVLLKEFPNVQVAYADTNSFLRFQQLLMRRSRTEVATDGRYLYFASPEQLAAMDETTLTEVLAHEYMHIVQRSRDKFVPLKKVSPLLLALVLVILGGWFGSLLLIAGAYLPLLPIYSVYVIHYEFEAYRMSILARIACWSNKKPLPPTPYELMQPTDESLRSLVDNVLFSSTYYSQWAPTFVRRRYYNQLRAWRWEVMQIYFKKRLAFESGNTYIGYTAVEWQPFNTVLDYLVSQLSLQ